MGQYFIIELGNLLEQVVEGLVKCIEGVGGVNVFGLGYVMWIWMDFLWLVQFQLMFIDIISVVENQNSIVFVGDLGSQLVVVGQQFMVMVMV